MANVRVYELAKELNMSNHDVIAVLTELGIEVKSHSSSIDEAAVAKLKERVGTGGEAPPAEPPPITLPAQVTVRQLAELLGVPTAEIQKALVKQGALVAVNQVVSPDLAQKATVSLGYKVAVPEPPKVEEPKPTAKEEAHAEKPAEPKPKPEPPPELQPKPKRIPRPEDLVPRPPVVTILGHVDHGKTTLLDAIRNSNVVDQEFGGITQHIGAYQVEIKGKKITFLDTPGHEAFTAMRARGAQVTDIAVLIVAADDGVMPQTIEALDHARAAGVQIIVAINKIDKPDANPERTKQQLAEQNLLVEEWGGDTVSVGVSAKTREHLDDLLDMILLVAELAELKADPTGPAEATVVEAQLDKGKGPIATVLVSSGMLKQGDVVVVGQSFGRIKAMLDDHSKRIQEAGPATPVEIVGLSSVPLAGDKLEVAENEKEARQLAEARTAYERSEKFASTQRITLADLYKQLQEGTVKDLNLILKADVQGSAEAIRQSLERLSTDEVRVNLIHSGVGNIGESDILLASASNAVVIGFNVKVDNQAKQAAEAERIDVRTYKVIYELLDEVKAAMEGLLEPDLVESVVGHAEVRQLFRLPRGGSIAGCYVTDGQIERNSQARVLRGGETVHTGKVSSLRHVKEDVREMGAGFECGIMVDGFTDFQVGDIVEAFTIQEIARRI
ncbi:MAG: translation initiation factor IF-2 [Armatimonadetes bacterium]|nr:translation initiation factor IF-2 [Armatimonadota bacterium]